MTELGPRFREIFFQVYENLPRQGPGNRACAARALGLCRVLPEVVCELIHTPRHLPGRGSTGANEQRGK